MNIPLEIVVNAEAFQTPDALASLMDKLSDFAPVLSQMATVMEAGLLENFESQGAGSWPALAPSTKVEKARKGLPTHSEERTDLLKDALTVHDAPGHICVINDNSVSIGVDSAVVPYFNTQNFGDASRHLPARLMLQVGDETIERLIELVTEWLGGGEAVRVYAA